MFLYLTCILASIFDRTTFDELITISLLPKLHLTRTVWNLINGLNILVLSWLLVSNLLKVDRALNEAELRSQWLVSLTVAVPLGAFAFIGEGSFLQIVYGVTILSMVIIRLYYVFLIE